MELMQEDDVRRAWVDRISERSGVSKATIYKWWPNRTAVAFAKALAMASMPGRNLHRYAVVRAMRSVDDR
jgi:AcrR family transcriptional regulator